MTKGTVLVLALAACNHDKDAKPAQLLDTGWFTTDVTGTGECKDRFQSWSPEDGDTAWYWRDRPKFYTQTTNQAAYTVFLQDADGVRLDTTQSWDEDSGLSFTLHWDGFLQSDTEYTLGMTDCAAFQSVVFHTGALGRPLSVDPTDLAGNTYLLDLANATWIEPPVLGALIGLQFKDPVLLGIRYADATQIDLLGGLGQVDTFGNVSQNLSLSSWDFPLADFSGSPFLDARAPSITLSYANYDAPVTDFVYQATFSADGTSLGGGDLSGIGDTRYLGGLLGQEDNPGILCELAAGDGVPCEPCPGDSEPYCLHLHATQLNGTLLPGLVMVDHP